MGSAQLAHKSGAEIRRMAQALPTCTSSTKRKQSLCRLAYVPGASNNRSFLELRIIRHSPIYGVGRSVAHMVCYKHHDPQSVSTSGSVRRLIVDVRYRHAEK